ncbi:MAG: ABC transporter ATP-binding protein/permease [Deltaproteobacteria bacterium]|jgi:ATP-binding cassette subfamily B protein|nr:ABC transporter ATP-binding protein/permease [Deltaproteobacteria bacterium]
MKNLSLLAPYFKKSVLALSLGFVFLMLCDFGQMVIPRLVGHIIDLLAEDAGTGYFKLIWVIMAIALMVAILRYGWRHLIYGFSRRMEKALRQRLYSNFVSLSLSWHNVNSSGDLMALATNDIEAVRLAMGFGLVSLMDALVLGSAAILFMLSISPSLCLFAFVPLPLITVLTSFFGRRIYRRVLETQNIFGALTEVVREHISGLKVIRAMALEDLAKDEVNREGIKYMNRNIHVSVVMGLFFPLLSLLTNLAIALTLFFGGRYVIFGDISPGEFVAFLSYLALLAWPLMAMGFTIGLLQQGLASLTRLARVLSVEEIEVHPIATSKILEKKLESIEFKSVTFTYPGRKEPALRSLSFSFPAKSITALTGPTGSGKSTLAALLVALYEPDSGEILINGVPSTEYSLSFLRSLFAYVPQDGHIFTGTLLDNIAFGKPEASEDECLEAALKAGLTLEKWVFPDGLYTRVGEKGMTLSGGQRQRLALARAILSDPDYLILDDTLSAVDASVEDKILNNLIESRQDRGTLIISHRVTSLKRADNFLVLEKGTLSAMGTFKELQKNSPYFKRIMNLANLGIDIVPPPKSLSLEPKATFTKRNLDS